MTASTLTILYGTETGNSRGLANKVADKAQKNGLTTQVIDLANYTVAQLAALDHPFLLIISTWDEGEPPARARRFCRELFASSADLSHLTYTVLALGDKEYEQYCACGRKIDEQLSALGAKAFLPRADLGSDFMVSYIGWSKNFWKQAASVYGVAK